MNNLLSGLRVIEGSAFVAAPSAGMTLSQMGAEVIRFDPIGGGLDYNRWPVTDEGTSLYWTSLNKGKKSIALDIRRPEGREIAVALISAPGPDAGIFLTNFPAAGWLDYEKLKAQRQDLIMVNVKGDRDGGSGIDYTVNCAVGFPMVTGHSGNDRPVNHVLPAWDVSTGLYAVNGLLAAERHRSRTGEGQFVSVALSDVAFATAATLGYVAEAQINEAERTRTGNDLYGSYIRDFKTKDNRYVVITALTPGHWRALVQTLDLGDAVAAIETESGLDLGKEGNRYRTREQISALIEPWCAARSLDEVEKVLDEGRVLWGPYRTFNEALEKDWRFSIENPIFQNVLQPGVGNYMMPGLPMDFSASERSDVVPAPLLGQHTEEILGDVLKLSSGEIGRLHDDGLVAGQQI
jgi:2-methylfumaryl-CoA isomerase